MPAAARLAPLCLCAALTLAAPARADEPAVPAPPADAAGDVTDGLFLQSRDGQVVLFPGGRLQVDGAFFPRQTPKSGLFIRRARVELAGWLGPLFYFDLSGDFAPAPPAGADVAPSALPAADDYLAFAPLGDRLIVQAGQFDAPFTLENRTSDATTDFIERAMVARTFGAPFNKEVGVMAHGLVGGGRLYYSGGLFDGEGPGFRNLDNQADVIGRVVATPFLAGGRAWRRFSIGLSAWHGDHVLGAEAPVQATPGGVVFFTPHWTAGAAGLPYALHAQGSDTAVGGELDLPLGDRFGARGELVWKRQHFLENDASAPPGTPAGDAVLDGICGYVEVWYWLWGDARLLPTPGRELPLRVEGEAPPGARLPAGLQLAARGEVLNESLTSDTTALGDPGIATTRVVSGTVGLNYWRGRLVRLSANYVLNAFGGTSITALGLVAAGRYEQELLLRLAASL